LGVQHTLDCSGSDRDADVKAGLESEWQGLVEQAGSRRLLILHHHDDSLAENRWVEQAVDFRANSSQFDPRTLTH
jgi:hypothetical protein